jgi:hypothetical protein
VEGPWRNRFCSPAKRNPNLTGFTQTSKDIAELADSTVSCDQGLTQRTDRRLKTKRALEFRFHQGEQLQRVTFATKGWVHKNVFDFAGVVIAAIADGGIGIGEDSDAGRTGDAQG